ncbi:MAG: hypothetical protein IJS61_09055 [Firmicutes bacterium]|nr:hypothetical protein [Bacillota bacterium]
MKKYIISLLLSAIISSLNHPLTELENNRSVLNYTAIPTVAPEDTENIASQKFLFMGKDVEISNCFYLKEDTGKLYVPVKETFEKFGYKVFSEDDGFYITGNYDINAYISNVAPQMAYFQDEDYTPLTTLYREDVMYAPIEEICNTLPWDLSQKDRVYTLSSQYTSIAHQPQYWFSFGENYFPTYEDYKKTLATPVEEDVQIMSFALDVLKGSLQDNKNIVFSPLGLSKQLQLLESGADSASAVEIQKVLYGNADKEKIKEKEASATKKLNNTGCLEEYNVLILNSQNVDGVNEDFSKELEKASGDVLTFDFTHKDIDKTINSAISDITNEKITSLPGRTSEEESAILVNTLSFEEMWKQVIPDNHVGDGDFRNSDGKITKVEMLKDQTDSYLDPGIGEGSFKYTENYVRFCFLQPPENMGISEYVNSLDPRELCFAIQNPLPRTVNCSFPSFKISSDIDLKNVLYNLGLTSVVGNKLSFPNIAHTKKGYPLYINSASQSAFIEVDRNGLKAGAVGVFRMPTGSLPSVDIPPADITLDRPFVFLVCDRSNIPIYMGVVNTLSEIEQKNRKALP